MAASPMDNNLCEDCRFPCTMESGHYYTATKAAWAMVNAKNTDHLCLNCFEHRLGRSLSEADFIALPHEIMARFAGKSGEPGLRFEWQRDLESWRAMIRPGRKPRF